MRIDFNKPFNYFIFFIIFIKVIFILSAIGHIILSHNSSSQASKIDAKLLFWKQRTEFIFIASMALLLIYYFKPGRVKHIDTETSFLFFLFGIILIFTANWGLFIKESPWVVSIVNSMK